MRFTAMKCSELQLEISLFADGVALTDPSITAHLAACGECRTAMEESRILVHDLRSLSEAGSSRSLNSKIKTAIRHEKEQAVRLPFVSTHMRDWLMLRLMPVTVGVATTLILTFGSLTAMLSSIEDNARAIETASMAPRQEALMLAADTTTGVADMVMWVSPADYAMSRRDVSQESPSINPNGTLIALSRSLLPSIPHNDEIVVVADVDSNGRAYISETVGTGGDGELLARLERAFGASGPGAPFVPASFDGRPGMVRTVFRFHTVDVSARDGQ
jgi:hypothetical protein